MVSLSYRAVRDLSSQQGGRQVDSYFIIAGNCAHIAAPDPYAGWSLSYRLQMLAFEAELAHLPRSLIAAIWEALGTLDSFRFSAPARSAESPQLIRGQLDSGCLHTWKSDA